MKMKTPLVLRAIIGALVGLAIGQMVMIGISLCMGARCCPCRPSWPCRPAAS